LGIGERIKQARLEAGFTQDQLAELIGVGMRQVQYYEAGESDPYRKLSRIAEVTHKPIGWLLHGDEITPLSADDEILARLAAVESLLQDVLRRLPAAPHEPEEAT